jgi:hypothetical protein
MTNQPVGVQAEVVVVTCGCGTLPLEAAVHANSTDAWQAAAAHVALTARVDPVTGESVPVCTPNMHRDTVPAALAPTPKERRS